MRYLRLLTILILFSLCSSASAQTSNGVWVAATWNNPGGTCLGGKTPAQIPAIADGNNTGGYFFDCGLGYGGWSESASCPPGAIWGPGFPPASAGQGPNAPYMCELPASTCTAGQTNSYSYDDGPVNSNSSPLGTAVMNNGLCANGCTQIMNPGANAITKCYNFGGTEAYCDANFTSNGTTCTPGSTTPGNVNPTGNVTSCPSGQSIATNMDGSTVCLSNVPTTGSGSSSGGDSGGGSSGSSGSGSTSDPGTGSSSGSGNTSGSGNSSGSSGNSGSGSGNSGTPNQQQQTICQQNPQLNICNNSTVNNQCTAGVATVSCTGDAIECAVAQATADQNCREKQTISDIKASTDYQLGQAVDGGNDPMASKLPTPDNAVSVSVGTITANGWLGASSCFADKDITLLGNTVTIPFSQLCQYLIALRAITMAIAGIASFRMLQGTFLQN